MAQGMNGLVSVVATPAGDAIDVEDVSPGAQRRVRPADRLVLVRSGDSDTGADDAPPPFEQHLLIW